MFLKGLKINAPKPLKHVIFREGVNFEFECGAVMDYTLFNKLCPEPKAPLMTVVATGAQKADTSDRRYIKAIDRYAGLRVTFMILQSLSATQELVWETVKMDDPDTWDNYETELRTVLTQREYDSLVMKVFEANNPTKARRDEALENFTFMGTQPVLATNSQQEEHTITPSTEPANASA